VSDAARLPDPRRYAADAGDNELARLATAAGRGDAAARAVLRAGVREHLESGDDAALRQALARAPSALVYRDLWESICSVAESPGAGSAGTELVARLFAMPVVLVAGARRTACIPGAVPNIGEVQALLEQRGALGATRNFGLSAELCPLEALERISPSHIFRCNRDYCGASTIDIRGAAIEVAAGSEQAHLRFLLGAGITPAHLPSFLETAANIATWGSAFTRAIARQLVQDGLTLLPLARPPAGLLAAAHAGRCAVIETAFQLFVSHTLRAFRTAAGEPIVVVTAHRDACGAEVRVSVSSLLDDALLDGFRWPLHPLDDINAVISSIAGLLRACRVEDVRWMPQVVTTELERAGPAFTSVRELTRTATRAMRH
jgi:hypothetical protein